MAGFMLKATVLLVIAQLGGSKQFVIDDKSEIRLVRKETGGPAHKELNDDKAKSKTDPCQKFYVEGKVGTNDCDVVTHKHIEDLTTCGEAADEYCKVNPDGSNKATGGCRGSPFEVIAVEQDFYPKRCFLTNDSPPKVRYNNAGALPANLSADGLLSTPICIEAELHEVEVKEDGTYTCPDGYSVISHEGTCRDAATCLTVGPQPQFRVLEATNNANPNDIFTAPNGCSINPATNLTRFNSNTPTTPLSDTSIVRKAICNTTLERGHFQ